MRSVMFACVACGVVAATPAYSQAAKFVERFGDWMAYASDAGGKKICFAVSEPKDMKPKGVKRGPVYFYISEWPAEKVSGEISVKMGYPLKEGNDVEVKIGGDTFKLFVKDEGAYVESADTEKKLVEAMKKGSTMVIQGRSTRGTLTTDEYSLSGATAALDRSQTECK
ncbi:MAG: invasion associated locus B family protein [Hyphomicrobiales bacterium]